MHVIRDSRQIRYRAKRIVFLQNGLGCLSNSFQTLAEAIYYANERNVLVKNSFILQFKKSLLKFLPTVSVNMMGWPHNDLKLSAIVVLAYLAAPITRS